MNYIKIIILVFVIVFVGIQFIPATRNEAAYETKNDFMLVHNVPKPLVSKINISCYDCHSNNTNYPWYNKIQPMAWFLEKHITEGKTELNFSEWGDYSDRRKKSKLKSIISQIKNDEMPLRTYTFLHRNAGFSEDEKINILGWFEKLRDSI